MVRCPNCQAEELPGALFCSNCGARLRRQPGSAVEHTQAIESTNPSIQLPKLDQSGAPPPPPDAPPGARISLHLLASGKILPLKDGNEFTLGRISRGQPLIPEVDLGPYDAYEQGVSRLHAVIQIREDEIGITDLGSANGTRLNGVRLSAHTRHPLRHGDLISLGTLKIQALIPNL